MEAFDINAEINAYVKDNENDIVDLNRNDQLYDKGIDSQGKAIRPKYALSTRKTKKGITSHVTTRDSGIWHDSFFIKYAKKWFKISSGSRLVDGFKVRDWLIQRYGDLMGLTNSSLNKVSRGLKPHIQKRMLEWI